MKQYNPGDVVYYLDSRNPREGEYPNVVGPAEIISHEGGHLYYIRNLATKRKSMLYLSQMYDNAEDAGEAAMNWR